MKNVFRKSLSIKHYWGRVEFAPGRGQIHLHMLGIVKNKAYLKDFYKAQSLEDKAAVVDKYTREKLDMAADVNIKDDDRNYFTVDTQSPLSKSSVKYATKTSMFEFYVRTVCVIIATSSVSKITRKTSHVLAV